MVFTLDWRINENYSHMKLHSKAMWAWEFMRRNEEYEDFYVDALKKYKILMKKVRALRKPNTIVCADSIKSLSESSDISIALSFDEAMDYDVPEEIGSNVLLHDGWTENDESFYLDIRGEAQNKWGIRIFSNPNNHSPIMFFCGSETAAQIYRGANIFRSMTEEEDYIATIKIDLREHLEPQIQFVRGRLKEMQRQLKVRPSSPKIHAQQMMNYIRVLDAKNSGAQRKYASKLIFPKLDGFESCRTYSEALKAASRLANGGYKKWLINSGL
jgi:hypothetical protein